jgi:hypothetical protein
MTPVAFQLNSSCLNPPSNIRGVALDGTVWQIVQLSHYLHISELLYLPLESKNATLTSVVETGHRATLSNDMKHEIQTGKVENKF